MTSPLIAYWPSEKAVEDVIKTDAESAHGAVVLAVHQPMRFRKRPVGSAGNAGEEVDEHDLLETFLAQNSDGRVILPIVGDSGSGKSHVVRWLDIQLSRLPDASSRMVIRIPKGRSLKGVLSDILEKVTGAQYEPFREKLRRAQSGINPTSAAGLLCEMLADQVSILAEEARSRSKSTTELGLTPEDLKHRITYGDSRLLPTLLRNQVLRDAHFTYDHGPKKQGVIRRLVAQLFEERSTQREDDRQHLFEPNDLEFAPELSGPEAGTAATRAMRDLQSGERRSQAAKVLNAALDRAKQQLLGIDRDMTVTELFLQIREQLERDKKELILLVEDFAVLSGLQGQLLQVMIKEAYRDGKKVLCTIRAALAYTPGYLQTDTVLTRANYEYLIPNDEDRGPDEILQRTRRLVGAYLNAARVGADALVERLAREQGNLKPGWVPRFEASLEGTAQDQLAAFGDVDEIPLFPFNEPVVDRLLNEHYRSASGLKYVPRTIINFVLLPVLRCRSDFESGAFPERHLASNFRLSDASFAFLDSLPQARRDTYHAFAALWLHPVPDWSAAQKIAEGFGLPDLGSEFWGNSRRRPSKSSSTVKAVAPVHTHQVAISTKVPAEPSPKKPQHQRPAPTATGWEAKFNAWYDDGRKWTDEETLKLRRDIIGPALLKACDFWVPSPDARFDARWWEDLGIHNSSTKRDALLQIAPEDRAADTVEGRRLATELASVAYFSEAAGKEWLEKDELETSVAAYCSFVGAQAPVVESHLRSRSLGLPWDPVDRLVRGLALAARICGVPDSDSNDPASLLSAMLDTEWRADLPHDWPGTGWRGVVAAAERIRCAPTKDDRTWRHLLLEYVGARKGEGDPNQALDIARLREPLMRQLQEWTLDTANPGLSPTIAKTTAPGRAIVSAEISDGLKLLPRALKEELSAATTWADRAGSALLPWNAKTFLSRMAGVLDELQRLPKGVPAPAAERIKDAATGLKDLPLPEAIETASSVGTLNDRGAQIAALGRIRRSDMKKVEQLLKLVDEALGPMEKQLASQVTGADKLRSEAVAGFEAEVEATLAALEEALA